jgi:hypothetical protein
MSSDVEMDDSSQSGTEIEPEVAYPDFLGVTVCETWAAEPVVNSIAVNRGSHIKTT